MAKKDKSSTSPDIKSQESKPVDWKGLLVTGGVGAIGGALLDRFILGNEDWKSNLLGAAIGGAAGAGGYGLWQALPKGTNKKDMPNELEIRVKRAIDASVSDTPNWLKWADSGNNWVTGYGLPGTLARLWTGGQTAYDLRNIYKARFNRTSTGQHDLADALNKWEQAAAAAKIAPKNEFRFGAENPAGEASLQGLKDLSKTLVKLKTTPIKPADPGPSTTSATKKAYDAALEQYNTEMKINKALDKGSLELDNAATTLATNPDANVPDILKDLNNTRSNLDKLDLKDSNGQKIDLGTRARDAIDTLTAAGRVPVDTPATLPKALIDKLKSGNYSLTAAEAEALKPFNTEIGGMKWKVSRDLLPSYTHLRIKKGDKPWKLKIKLPHKRKYLSGPHKGETIHKYRLKYEGEKSLSDLWLTGGLHAAKNIGMIVLADMMDKSRKAFTAPVNVTDADVAAYL